MVMYLPLYRKVKQVPNSHPSWALVSPSDKVPPPSSTSRLSPDCLPLSKSLQSSMDSLGAEQQPLAGTAPPAQSKEALHSSFPVIVTFVWNSSSAFDPSSHEERWAAAVGSRGGQQRWATAVGSSGGQQRNHWVIQPPPSPTLNTECQAGSDPAGDPTNNHSTTSCNCNFISLQTPYKHC